MRLSIVSKLFLLLASGACAAEDFASDSEDDAPGIFTDDKNVRRKHSRNDAVRDPAFLDFTLHASQRPSTHRYDSCSVCMKFLS